MSSYAVEVDERKSRPERRAEDPVPMPPRLDRAGALSPGTIAALQRTAGNQAVGQLMRKVAPLASVLADSASPEKVPAEAAELVREGEDEVEPAIGAQLQRVARARLQRSEDDTLAQCPPYWRWETPRDVNTYNCAGLAWRTYDFRGDLDAERSAAAAGTASGNTPGVVKHWFWEYDMHLETDDGRRSRGDVHDFHTVAGVVTRSGGDPDDVWSKNGHRPVYGPRTGPGWRPPARDRATSNDPSDTPESTDDGAPLYKVRSNFKEIVASRPCSGH
jgi:hypothetical protein